MPVRIIGMIGVTPPRSDTTLHVIEGGLSPSYVTEAAHAHEVSGFDLVLVGYSSSSAPPNTRSASVISSRTGPASSRRR
jgi:alkanesulfonate monooxygenase